MKNKLLFILLSCAALVGFVACSNDDEEQDVNVVSQVNTENEYYYTVEGTFTDVDTAKTVYTVEKQIVSVQWNTSSKSNGDIYDLPTELSAKNATAGTVYLGSYGKQVLIGTVLVLNGKYYDYTTAKELTGFTASPKSDEFSYTYTVSDVGTVKLTFKKL